MTVTDCPLFMPRTLNREATNFCNGGRFCRNQKGSLNLSVFCDLSAARSLHLGLAIHHLPGSHMGVPQKSGRVYRGRGNSATRPLGTLNGSVKSSRTQFFRVLKQSLPDGGSFQQMRCFPEESQPFSLCIHRRRPHPEFYLFICLFFLRILGCKRRWPSPG